MTNKHPKFRKSSCSDNQHYPQFCLDAANNPDVFSNFRANKILQGIVEVGGPNMGANYAHLINHSAVNLSHHYDKFLSSETVGCPRVFEYSLHGKSYLFSPTTLRYINVANNLKLYFGDITNFNIVEIGGGYGGLCKIICDAYSIQSYTLIDLEETISLSKRFLNVFSIEQARFFSGTTLLSQRHDMLGDIDLVISNYAFTELNREWQDIYWNYVVGRAKRGYMECNFTSHTWDSRQFSETKLTKQLDSPFTIFKESPPLTQQDVRLGVSLLTWQ